MKGKSIKDANFTKKKNLINDPFIFLNDLTDRTFIPTQTMTLVDENTLPFCDIACSLRVSGVNV